MCRVLKCKEKDNKMIWQITKMNKQKDREVVGGGGG